MFKLRLGALLATALFAIYGVKEAVTAIRCGDFPSDGLEALTVGTVVFGAYLVLTKVHRRTHPEEHDAK
jgi:hypothetical protein